MVSSFDFDGNFVERVAMNNVLYSSFASAIIPHDNTMIVSFGKEENGYYIIYIYKSDGFGNLQLKKKLIPESNDDIITVNNMYITPENNLLINFTHVSRKLQNLTIVPKWTNWTLFNGNDFYLITSIKNYDISNELEIYPNPVIEQINFKPIITNVKEITITNKLGLEIKKILINNQNISVGDLLPGLYFLKIILKDGIISTQKFIKT
ncbi:MAG: T9SS type A sorting domain-containing protein [Bacteroidota bacterium]|nr:T9SS type A sorting domain-containing protein [Bacteroidota bacterium]